MSGRLVITAAPGSLDELQALAAELSERAEIVTQGKIVILPPEQDRPESVGEAPDLPQFARGRRF